jgi:NAD(P)H-dependent FMN reductase
VSFSIHHVDIAAFNPPVFNEEVMPSMVPAMQQFAHDHSKIWSAEIARYDAYILVTACYNGGPLGGIKNAIDYLYNEWIGKPMMLISHGIKGGKTASDSLKTTLEVMNLNLVEMRLC